MIIVAITDIHARTKALTSLSDQLQSADLLLLCGDITHFGHRREMADILQLVKGINPSVLAVTGNCDYPDTEKFLVDENLSLNATVREFRDLTLFGLSGSLPCPGRTPNELTEEEFGVLLGNLVIPEGKPLLMVSHQPPYGTMNDEVSKDQHVGSKTIREHIQKVKPLICFTGHIHEGIGIDHIGNTAVVNPGPAGTGSYVRAEVSDGKIKNLEIVDSFHR